MTAVLSPSRERWALLGLLAVQFTHIMDFMVMMPLGPQLMRALVIGPDAFGHLVASYGLSAAVAGVAAAFFLDRLDRRRGLLLLYGGFIVSTLACALAPTYELLLVARLAAGACGGVAGSIVLAAVGDLVPPERRGAALGRVMTAFPLASVLGVPAGVVLANRFEWHAPFALIAAVGVAVLVLVARALPPLPPPPASAPGGPSLLGRVWGVALHPVHVRAFLLTATVVATGSCVIPFLAASMAANVGVREEHLPLLYLCGGLATIASIPWLGRRSDRGDKLVLLAVLTVLAAGIILVVTRLGPLPLPLALLAMSAFMVLVSGRFPPAMAMITNRVSARDRGSFMSLHSSVQQMAAGGATLLASQLVAAGEGGRLEHYADAGWASLAFALLSLFAARSLVASGPELRSASPGEAIAAVAVEGAD